MALFGFGKNKENKEKSLFPLIKTVTHIDGLPGYKTEDSVTVILNDTEQQLEMYQGKNKNKLVCLKYNQIVNVDSLTGQEVLAKEKNSIGRAVAGGIVLGPLGAVVGGISGVGSKKKVIQDNYLIINYKSANLNKINVITLSNKHVDIYYFKKAKKALLERIIVENKSIDDSPTYL